MMQALAELALAANSNIYRASADATPAAHGARDRGRAARCRKKCRLARCGSSPKELSPTCTPYYEWDYSQGGEVEDIRHAQFELGCLAVILADQVRLNALLATAGHTERIPLDPSMFVRFANTFLRIVWHNNDLSARIDGSDVQER